MIEFEEVLADVNKELAYKFVGDEKLKKSMFFIHIDYIHATSNEGGIYHIGGETPAYFLDAISNQSKMDDVVGYQGLDSSTLYIGTDIEVSEIEPTHRKLYFDAVREAKIQLKLIEQTPTQSKISEVIFFM